MKWNNIDGGAREELIRKVPSQYSADLATIPSFALMSKWFMAMIVVWFSFAEIGVRLQPRKGAIIILKSHPEIAMRTNEIAAFEPD